VSSDAVFSITNTATSGVNYGGRFMSASTSGTGVSGSATATSGFTFGVYGRNLSTSGTGVYGAATADSGVTYGVFGRTHSATNWCAGVYGWASASSGDTWGVYGRSDSTIGKASPASRERGTQGVRAKRARLPARTRRENRPCLSDSVPNRCTLISSACRGNRWAWFPREAGGTSRRGQI
jgi:hypothetical protein